MAAQGDVNHPVGAQTQTVGTVLAGTAFELDDRADLLERPVSVFVGQSVQRRAFRPVAGDKHFAIECQNSVARFDLVTVGADVFRDAVTITIENQQQRAAFLRQDDVPELVERHRDHRADLFVTENALDAKTLLDLKAFSLFGLGGRDDIFITVPRDGVAKLSETTGRSPQPVIEHNRLPHRAALGAGPPRGVAAEREPLVLIAGPNRNPRGHRGGITVRVDHAYRDHVATDFQVIADVELLHLSGR